VHSRKPGARRLIGALKAAGIERIVLSPGSRNAPLVIEMPAHGYEPEVIVDERAAAFTALGMARRTGKPVALVCTSGTAVLNYHPAVAEAFYSQVPLIVISADRPPYRIDRGEGQTIRQHGVLAHHTARSVTLPLDGEGEETPGLIAEALETAFTRRLPVHINIPFEEPLYETGPAPEEAPLPVRTQPEEPPLPDTDLDRLEHTWKQARRKLIIVSQLSPSPVLNSQLDRLAKFDDTVILTENLANVRSPRLLGHIDRLVFPMDEHSWRAYAPDLVITVGLNIISKKIKFLLRAVPPALGHWHIGTTPLRLDTFDVLRYHADTTPEMFFSQLLFRIYDSEPSSDYSRKWRELAAYRARRHEAFARTVPPGDWYLYHVLSQSYAGPGIAEWGNSTVVRYAQLFDFDPHLIHYGNRGTSGIDGTLSTAAGTARASDLPVLAVAGDLSLQYDNNAFWAGMPANLKVIVVNNGGGDIFRFIPGPQQVPGYEKYFVYRREGPFDRLAAHYGIPYRRVKAEGNRETFARAIREFLASEGPGMLDADTSAVPNAEILRAYFDFLR